MDIVIRLFSDLIQETGSIDIFGYTRTQQNINAFNAFILYVVGSTKLCLKQCYFLKNTTKL